MIRRFWIFGGAGIILCLDQLLKWLVKHNMNLYQSIPVIGEDFFRLTYIENDGIAFGISFGGRTFLIIFTIAATLFLIYYALQLKNSPFLPKLALTLILGGALGNLSDRIFRGQVIDFLDFDFFDFVIDRWPVFNIADSAVSVGITILIIHYILFNPEGKSSDIEETNGVTDGINRVKSYPEPKEGAD